MKWGLAFTLSGDGTSNKNVAYDSCFVHTKVAPDTGPATEPV